MKRPSPPCATPTSGPGWETALDLEFPDWSAAVSEPRRLPWDAIYRRSLEALPHAMAKPGFEERRLATKNRLEFVL